MKPFQVKKVIRVNGKGLVESIIDEIAEEKRLILKVNGQEVLRLLCTPTMIRELVVGFLITEGLIEGSFCAERMSIEYFEDKVVVDVPAEGQVRKTEMTITSGCVGGISFSGSEKDMPSPEPIKITPERLHELFRLFQDRSGLYQKTGCVHSACVSDGRSIIVLAEDIGRHNAVDKAIGYCILEGVSLNDKIMLVSGRLSSEMVKKAAKTGIPIVASRTAPTTHAIEIAEKYNLTLIGFLRGRRFNIYSSAERITEG